MAFAFGSMSKEAHESYAFGLEKQAVLGGDERQPRLAIRPTSPAMLAALSGGTTSVIMQPGPRTSSTLKAKEQADVRSERERANDEAFERVSEELDDLERE